MHPNAPQLISYGGLSGYEAQQFTTIP
jgi:hypothetical protein